MVVMGGGEVEKDEEENEVMMTEGDRSVRKSSLPTSSITRSAHLEHSLKGLMGLLMSEQCRSSSITNSRFLSSAKQSRESFSPAQKALVSAPLISENNCANAENQVRRVGTRRGE